MDSSDPSEGRGGDSGAEARLSNGSRNAWPRSNACAKTGLSPRPQFCRPPPLGDRPYYAHLETDQKAEDSHCRIAGRVMSRREHGKAAFLTGDGWDDLQIY